MQIVAQKLNIIVRSYGQVRANIASNTDKTELDSFGDLERDFGVQQKIATSPTQDTNEVNGEHEAPDYPNGDVLKDDDVMNKSMSSEGTANTEASSIVLEPSFEKQNSEHEETLPANGDIYKDHVEERDTVVEKVATMAAESIFKNSAKSVESIENHVDSIIPEDSQNRLDESLHSIDAEGIESQTDSASQAALEFSLTRSPPRTPLLQSQNTGYPQNLEELQIGDDKPRPKNTTNPSPWTAEDALEPEDSDEEVVVFVPQPKRLSAQPKPVQQSSRPSTPKEQSQQKSAGQSPQISLVRPQSKGKAARHSPKPSVVGHAHPKISNAPTIIDPDAFGRDSRVNLNPNPRPQHPPNGHSNHRIRNNMHNVQGGQISRNSSRPVTRAGLPHNSSQENTRRIKSFAGSAAKEASNHKNRASRTSPRIDPPALEASEIVPTGVESKATMAAIFSKSHLSGSQAAESAEPVAQAALPGWASPRPSEAHDSADFVPRSALPNVELQSGAAEPRRYEPGEFIPRPPRPVREFKPRAPRAKVFEAAEFVPRDFAPRPTMPRAQSKQYLPEPESIEPRPSNNDVDYVLKSGSTRASARGRGRLWTPS